ncbi:MAG: zinc ribbon domain-containing protein YjdM [Flavobacteriales bacterium]
MSETITCPSCSSPFGYDDGTRLNCPECGHSWDGHSSKEPVSAESEGVCDCNGNVLLDGDSVVVIKDLPVKGAPKPIKAGTKVKKIRLVEGDHNISCKIDGFGAIGLKSEFVRKA